MFSHFMTESISVVAEKLAKIDPGFKIFNYVG
jgi:hypothetical protein